MSHNYNEMVGGNFRQIREQLGLRLTSVATTLEVGADTLSLFERGKTKFFKGSLAKSYFDLLSAIPGYPWYITYDMLVTWDSLPTEEEAVAVLKETKRIMTKGYEVTEKAKLVTDNENLCELLSISKEEILELNGIVYRGSPVPEWYDGKFFISVLNYIRKHKKRKEK